MKEDVSGKVQLSEMIKQKITDGSLDLQECEHIAMIQDVTPSADGCEKCLEIGDEWVHLRLCLICGHVGCCDDSKNKHASRHFHDTGHAVIVSYEPDEDWIWCYIDEIPIKP